MGHLAGRWYMEYNAVTFLQDLFEAAPSLDPDDLPGDWRCVFEERAAIMEYHGKLPRELAEAKALAETVRMMEAEKNLKITLDMV